MTIFRHQEGHLHLGILGVVVLFVVGFAGLFVYNSQSGSGAVLGASTGTWDSDACKALDDLSDAEFAKVTEAEEIAACGPDETDNLSDPCDSGAYINLSNEEYDRLCPINEPLDTGDLSDVDDTKDAAQGTPVLGTPVSQNNHSTTTSAKTGVVLSDKSACIGSLSQYNLSKIKSFGNARIKVRKAALKKANEQYTKKKSKSAARLKAQQTSANKKVKAAAKKAKYKLTKNDRVKVATPAQKTKNSKKDIATYNKRLNTYATSLKNAKTKQAAAQVVCSVIFDSQIYSYLVPKVRSQDSIDGLKFRVATYEVKAQTSSLLNKINKKAQSSSSTKARTLKTKMNTLQASQDGITPQAARSAQQAQGKKQNVFRASLQPKTQEIQKLLKAN